MREYWFDELCVCVCSVNVCGYVCVWVCVCVVCV